METKPVGIGLVVGNGFTLDFVSGAQGINFNKPIDWPVEVLGQPDLGIRDALPHFWKAVEEFRLANPRDSDWDVLRKVIGVAGEGDLKIEVETRHFLVLAFRWYHANLIGGPVEKWRWNQWIRDWAPYILTCVSFNYDCLVEYCVGLTGKPMSGGGHYKARSTYLFKPHGSVNYCPIGLTSAHLIYPLKFFARMNNCPIRVISPDEWGHAPHEPLVVLPYEENPYTALQWVSPGFSMFGKLAPQLTHLVIVGLSYHPADRKEIDYFIHCTSRACHIIVASPNPHPDLIKAIEQSGRTLHKWSNGPERLP